jgi:uncharacterized protein (TIGR03437 family)
MRPLFRSAGLVVLLVGVVAGQTATVQNAAFGSSVGVVFGYIFDPFVLAVPIFPATLTPQNVVSPGMLAVLSAPPATTPTKISIRPSGSDTPIRVEVVSSTPGQTTFVVPRNMPLGGAEIEYQSAGQPTGWTNVNVVAASFEFFRIGSGGPAIAQAVGAGGSLSPIGLTTPAQPGQTILLKGSGLGNVPFTVTVGGVPATVVTAAPHRANPGAEEIQIHIPTGVPDGCYVPVVLTYNSNAVTTTISKTSNGAACVHPFQLSVADMKTLDKGGTLMVGEIYMSTTLQVATPAAASRAEGASVQFRSMATADIAAFFPANQNAAGCQAIVPTSLAVPNLAYAQIYSAGSVNAGSSVFLQNGANTLSLPGPFGLGEYFATLPQPTQGPVANPPAPTIAGGPWKWYSTGGPDLAVSSFGFTLPAPFQLNGSGMISMNRNVDQTLTWNGAAFDSGALLYAVLPGSVTCTAPANSGTLTIPAALLGQIGGNSLGALSITVTEAGSFMPHTQLRLQNGSTLLMLVNYSTGETTPVDFQ